MKRSRALIGITAAAAATVLAAGPTATAGTVSDPIAEELSNPLQFTFDSNGRPLVAQAFGPGLVSKVTRNGNLVDVVQDGSGSISGVDTRGDRIAYTLSGGLPPDVQNDQSFDAAARGGVEGFTLLKQQNAAGGQKVLGNLGRAEANRNPDAHQVYGWLDYQNQCGMPAPEGTEPRGGIVESNPHSVAAAPGGGWYVADAAANTIWKVKDGKVRVAAVLKPRSVTITDQMVEQNNLDPCAEGSRYNLEPVPTDIEVGPGGGLFVTLLPGETVGDAPVFSDKGAVVRINPVTGRARLVAEGFAGATNLALDGNRIYVAELFADRVSRINTTTGSVRPVAYLPGPAGLEQHDGTLYVTSLFMGTLSTIDPSGPTQVPVAD